MRETASCKCEFRVEVISSEDITQDKMPFTCTCVTIMLPLLAMGMALMEQAKP